MIQISNIAKHGAASPAKMLASKGGAHIFNIQLAENTLGYADNGWFVGKGAWLDLDRYAAAAPTTFEGTVVDVAANGNWYVEPTTVVNAYLICNVPISDAPVSRDSEDYMTNAKDAVVRAYQPTVGDIIEISPAAISGTVAKGDTVELTTITGAVAVKQLIKQ